MTFHVMYRSHTDNGAPARVGILVMYSNRLLSWANSIKYSLRIGLLILVVCLWYRKIFFALLHFRTCSNKENYFFWI